jgi:glutamate racemase
MTHDLSLATSALPIGVFDSGMGGLTVLKSLLKQLPQESFIYFGDTARLPYGTKSKEIIIKYATQAIEKLLELKVKMIIIACNTATVSALEYLRELYPKLPIIGVVEPGAITAANNTKTNNIGIIATERTILSKCYQNTLTQINPNFNIIVSIAEEGHIDDDIAKLVLTKYLTPLIEIRPKIDVLLLGCTHFPVFKKIIETHVDNSITIVDSAECTSYFSYNVLNNKNILNKNLTTPSVQYYVTDSPNRFKQVGKLFLDLEIDNITLI